MLMHADSASSVCGVKTRVLWDRRHHEADALRRGQSEDKIWHHPICGVLGGTLRQRHERKPAQNTTIPITLTNTKNTIGQHNLFRTVDFGNKQMGHRHFPERPDMVTSMVKQGRGGHAPADGSTGTVRSEARSAPAGQPRGSGEGRGHQPENREFQEDRTGGADHLRWVRHDQQMKPRDVNSTPKCCGA